ncbi:MAG: dioxygenase, partial [Myxococcales bacterium]|nr:dioxygenase [Myxococcales bacterium]
MDQPDDARGRETTRDDARAPDKLSRRAVLSVGVAATGVAATTGVLGASARPRRSRMTLPAIYLPHGGGPWPWVQNFGGPGAHDSLRGYLEGLASRVEPPAAILCVTAHWEAPVATVSTSARPGMLYDYYGFPEHTYRVRWPAPGSPDVAARVRALLGAAGIESAADPERGFDHGTFVPLSVAWP